MKPIRSRGYSDTAEPNVTIRLQIRGADKKVSNDTLLRWIRRIRRRYGNTDGVAYEVSVNHPLER